MFTDVQGSTQMWDNHPDVMKKSLRRHDQIVAQSIEASDGYVFSLAGDQYVAAFHTVTDALQSARQIQQKIADEPWPDTTPIRVRVGIHLGEAEERDNDYFGQVLNRTARIVSAIHGGQIVLSDDAAQTIDTTQLCDLGEHRMKDLAAPAHLWQVGTQSFPPLKTLRQDHHNLPVERTPLVGREEDINNLSKLVSDNRLVTLLGMGGSGKTRLGTAVAAEVEERFADGVWFVDLVPTVDAESVAEAIASAAGLRLAGGDIVGALASQASGKEMLIILDNCEHVTDDVADVADVLLESTATVSLLATSREPLDLPGENQVRVSPLLVESSIDAPAVQLFSSSAARVGAKITGDDTEIVAHICRQLDGLPLSIELAAAQLRQLTLSELAERLDRRFELLTRSRTNRRKRRHASLLEVLNDSWSMLDAAEQDLLKFLAAFPSSFELADAEGIVEDSFSVAFNLGGLTDRGLVSGDGHGSSRLLETVKLFVRKQWELDEDPARYFDAHTNWLLDYLKTHGVDNNYQSVSLAGWVIRHYDDHRAVEERLATSERLDDLAEMIGGMRWAYSRETGQRATALIERVERYHETQDLSTLQSASLNLAAAGAARAARDRRWLAHGADEAVRLYRMHGPSTELVVALIVASFTEVLRNPPQAFANLDEAQSIASDLGAETLVDATLAYRAHYAAMIGSVDDVKEVLAELEPRLDGDQVDNTTIMTLQAKMVANLTSDPEVARTAARDCFATAVALGLDHDWWMHLYQAMGAAAAGEVGDMTLHLDDANVLLQQSGADGLPDLLLPYITLAHLQGDAERSRRWITAVRHSKVRPGTGVVIGLYRHLRALVGLNDESPLETSTLPEIHEEAQAWVATQASEQVASPA